MTTFPKRLLAGFLSLSLLVSFVPTAILPRVAFAENEGSSDVKLLEPTNKDEIMEAAKSGGLIPVPQFDTGSKEYSISTYANDNLPASFDLRSANGKNLVTEVKNQNPWGDCWSFGSNGAAEVSLASTLGKTNNDLDFSERHTAWFQNTPLSSNPDLLPTSAKSQSGEGQISTYGGNSRMGTGGNSLQAAQMFASGTGVTAESVAPYGNNGNAMSSNDTWEVSDSSRFSSIARLKDYNNLGTTVTQDNSLDTTVLNNVKSELVAGRAVEMSYKADQAQPGASADSSYMNRDTWAQYNPNKVRPDHSVMIVGYDDTFSKDSFKTTPDGDGAFIVKNSWGHSEADSGLSYGDVNYGSYGLDNSGYFYLSYYDKTISSFASFEFDGDSYSETPYDTSEKIIDQYDYMPIMDSSGRGMGSDNFRYGSIYTAGENQTINSVVVYTIDNGMTPTVEVYKLNSNATNPEDGEKVGTGTATYPYNGLHAVSITAESGKDLTINKGDKYGVSVRLKNKSGFYYIPEQQNLSQTTASQAGYSFYGKAVVNQGESFIKAYNDSNRNFEWKDWNADNIGWDSNDKAQYVLDDPMIKVYSTKVTSGSTKHNVTFNDGSNSLTISGAPTSFDEGGNITLPTAPAKAGYTFDGWYKDSAFANKAGDAGATYTPTETADITLYAKYSLKTTMITWDLQSGTSASITALNGTADSVLTYSQACSLLNNSKFSAPTRSGYTFKGFYDAASNGKKYINADLSSAANWDKEAENSTLYAQWEGVTYNLKYMVDGTEDTSISPKSYVYGSNGGTVTLSTPTKVGHTFDGWYTTSTFQNGTKLQQNGTSFNTTATGDRSLYGRFIAKETALTFDMAGGTATTAPTSVKATFGSAMPTLSADNIPAKADNRFDGFFDAETGGTKYYNADGTSAKAWDKDVATATLYAHWISTSAPTHSVTFKDGNDALTIAGAPTEFTEGGSIELPNAPEKTGYNFAGWYTDEATTAVAGVAGAHYSPTATADLTLYAKYEAKTYSVTYKFNSTATDVTENRTYGIAYNLLNPTDVQKPSPTATFEGWYKTYDASTGAYSDKVESISTTDEIAYTLYAKWTYKFIEGQKVTFSIKASDDVVIRVDFPLDKLISITINGVDIKSLVEGTDYSLIEGSTLLTIKNAYVKKMNVGNNDVVFTYENGVATANVTVTNDNEPVAPDPEPDNPDPDVPNPDISEPDNSGAVDEPVNNPVQPSQKAQVTKTGDEANGLVFGMLTLLVAGAVVLVVSSRKKNAVK